MADRAETSASTEMTGVSKGNSSLMAVSLEGLVVLISSATVFWPSGRYISAEADGKGTIVCDINVHSSPFIF